MVEDQEMLDYRAAMAEQHAKLSDFLTFKAESKVLSKKFSDLASSGRMRTGDSHISDGTAGGGRRHRGSTMDEKALKVTYSYDGKVMPYRELQLEERKLNAPQIMIQDGETMHGRNSSLSSRTITLSSRHTKLRFDPKKKITAQFEANLEEIYDE